ncbi:MAG: glycosyltransferase family 4 protein [Deltaproteobacteria bacterium]|nr:glycosyltransferase family 4 protein [Deltaproteobacteria bacterium]
MIRRVLYLAVSGSRLGGAEVQYRYLAEDLDRRRYQPVLLTPAYGSLNRALDRAGVRNAAAGYPPWRRRTWWARRRARARLVALAREQQIGLVHADFNLGPYALAIAAALGVPSVLHVRRALRPSWVRRYGLATASGLIAIGSRYRDDLRAAGIAAEHVTVIEDAADVQRFAPRAEAARAEWPELRGRIVLGLVGRIEPGKRQLEFLRAVARLARVGRPVAALVVGAPNRDWPRYVRRVLAFPAAHAGECPVRFTGARHDVEALLASLDVLVTLSGGSVMLEAMASGVPVVTASDRPPAELVMVRDGEAGLVVPAGDADALVGALARLCDDPALRRALGARGRQRAEQRYARARLARQTEQFYDALLAADRAAAPSQPGALPTAALDAAPRPALASRFPGTRRG